MRQWLLQHHAEIAGYLGHTDEVLTALRALSECDYFDLLWFEGCPLLAEARKHPDYAPIHATIRARADAIVDAMWG